MRRLLFAISLLTFFVLPGQIPDFKPPTPLIAAIFKNDTQAVKRLLEAGANPNEGRFIGFAPLTLAVAHGNEAVVHALLARGADPQVTDGSGSTNLMWAAGGETPNVKLVDEFLRRGVDPNAQNKMGESALHWALRRGDLASIERLKAGGANDSAAVRQAVERAVAILQKSGPQFVKVSGCTSCHHQSLPQMVYGAARERGFQVDAAVSDQQVKAVLAMIKPLREPLAKGTIDLPSPGITLSYGLLGLAAEGYQRDENTQAMTLAILRTQTPEGSFPVFPARPPMEASSFTGTALSIRALQLFGEGVDDRIARARAWLLQARPATQEERSMRLLGLAWSKADRKHIDHAVAALLEQQRPDGGWAQLASLETDAYATGQALVALLEAGAVTPTSSVYQRGMAYLLRTQHPDGSWLVRSRSAPVQQLKDSGFPHGRDQWISAAGTSWASLALAMSQPKAAQQVAASR